MDLVYTIHQEVRTMTIALAGELDMASADELRDLLLAAIGRNDTTEVVVDLARVTSSGCCRPPASSAC